MMTASQFLLVLLDPDNYIQIGWGVMAFLTLLVYFFCWLLRRHRWWWLVLTMPLLLGWYVFLWGTYVGFSQLEVVRIEFASKDLPKEFDGYKIVQFSDAHVGTYTGNRQAILRRAIDSINAQHADMVVFTGDMQNVVPDEILPHQALLSSIMAKDGVFSVLGNHDYAMYLKTNDAIEIGRNEGMARSLQTEMGWTLLINDHRRIRRDSASIVIAGMENDGEPGGRFPQKGVLNSALYGVNRSEFVVMLEHDPTAWRRKILPHSHVQLTLSGHTHGGQISVLGLSAASFMYKEPGGMYYVGPRALYVSKGLGGVIPIRFGATPEIAVITLRCK